MGQLGFVGVKAGVPCDMALKRGWKGFDGILFCVPIASIDTVDQTKGIVVG